MYKILEAKELTANIFSMVVEAERVAKSCEPGQFVIVRTDADAERIPLTICDYDREKGTVTIVFQIVGAGTQYMSSLKAGDAFHDFVGPLGCPSEFVKENIEELKKKSILFVAGGVGTAPVYPQVKWLHEHGVAADVIVGAKTKDILILEDEMKAVAGNLYVTTDDGSYGRSGMVTQTITDLINEGKHYDVCVAIGPMIMMKFVCKLTKELNLPTVVSLNPIMVDGTGMCGACRVTVGGKTRFTCVDGPEFDAHQIDFNEMLSRLGGFKGAETEKMEEFVHHGECALSDRNADWRKALRETVKAKERTMIERVKMPERTPQERISSQRLEVNTGLTKEMAMQEARRCQDCANPTCMEGCPVGIDIPGFIKNIERGEILEAAAVLKKTSALPAVCGRVCPQEKQCESKCFYLQKMKKAPVAIGYLERFAADFERESGQMAIPEVAAPNGIKIAVIGSGPSGLSFAGDMVKRGYEVTVFEALHEIGGVLKYGIPEFRLPNHIVDVEIGNLKKMGVKFVTNFIVGMTESIEDLKKEGFKGFYVASGAGLPNFMNIPGENANGVLSSNEYLTRVNLMGADNEFSDTPVYRGKNVVVVGGGNTAMDSVRTAKRLGAERAMIVYRRSEEEMPARLEEVKHAKEEGCEFITLTNPVEYIADEKGRVKQVRVQKMELGEPDASGRRRPVPVEGSEYLIDADVVVVAVGVSPNPIVPRSVAGLEVSKKGTIVVNDATMQSNLPEFYAGGDIVRGGATVILAMGDGRRAAAHMDAQLRS